MGSDRRKITAENVEIFDGSGHERAVIDIWMELFPGRQERDYEKFQVALEKREITVFSDFGHDLASATKNITDVIKELAGSDVPGLTAALVTVYKRAGKGPGKVTAVGIPKLPAGEKFDLSKPTISLGGVEYKIPTRVVTPSEADLPDPYEFTQENWIALAKRCDLLFGLNYNKVLATDSQEYSTARAGRAALVWKVPAEDRRFFDTNTRFGSTSTLTYSEHFANTVHNSIFSTDANVSCPFGAGAVGFSRNQKHATASGSRKVYVTGIYLNAYVELDMRVCTALSDEFVKELRGTVDAGGTEQEKFDRLEAFFRSWGHVVSTHVQLGGAMYYVFSSVIASAATEDMIKTTAKAAVDLKMKEGSGGGHVGWQNADGKTVSDKTVTESTSWDVIGGDRSLVGSPDTWSQKLKDPNTWRICRRIGVTPIIDWLDDVDGGPALKKKVQTIWENGLNEIWGNKKRPAEFIFPVLNNMPFQIRTERPVTDTALKAKGSDVAGGKLRLVAPDMARNVDGSHKDYRDFLWMLAYTGHTLETGLKGEPLYVIVTYGDRLAARQLRRLGNPGRYCIALAGVSLFEEMTPPVKMPPLAIHQSGLFGSDKPLTLPSPGDFAEHLFWTVTPVIDGDTSSEDDPGKYRLTTLSGRTLYVETKRILKNIAPPVIAVERDKRNAGDSHVYLIPETIEPPDAT